MNRCLLVLGFVLLASLEVGANVGFRCKDSNTEISRKTIDNVLTLVITNKVDGSESYNSKMILPDADTIDAYQERFGTYYEIMANAQAFFPYMPESMMVFHIMRSNKLYKKGIQAFEGNAEAVDLPKMYCKTFIEAINKYY
jgi:hypothetical protein